MQIDPGEQQDDPHPDPFGNPGRRLTRQKGQGIAHKPLGIKGQGDDVADPHIEIEAAAEHPVAEALDQKFHRPARRWEADPEFGVGVSAEQGHDPAHHEGDPHAVARGLGHHPQDREDAGPDHAADADGYGGVQPDAAGGRRPCPAVSRLRTQSPP